MGTNSFKMGGLAQSAVREIANIGLGHATTALSSMTGRSFNMSVPDADSVPPELIPGLLGDEGMAVAVHMPIDGDTEGHIGFVMPWTGAQALWTMLLGFAPNTPEDVDDLAASAMLEVGNIIDSSFLAAISDMTSLRMESTPPRLSIDMSAAILESIVCEAALQGSVALAVRTTISHDESAMDGFFVFLPSIEGLRKMFAVFGFTEAA